MAGDTTFDPFRFVVAALLGIVAVAALLIVGRLATSPDDALYRALATSLASSGQYADTAGAPFAIRPPAYAALLAPLMAIGGPASSAPWVLQALMVGGLAALLVILLGSWVGLPAAIMTIATLMCVPDLASLGRALRVDVLQVLLVVVGLIAISHAIRREAPRWLILGGVAIGLSVTAKETSAAYLALPAAMWLAAGGRRSLAPGAIGASLAGVSIAWAWWFWVAIATGQLFPTTIGGPMVAGFIAMLLPVILATGAITAVGVARAQPGEAKRSGVGAAGWLVLVGCCLSAAAAMAVLLQLGSATQLDVVGELGANLRRFFRDEILQQLPIALPLVVLGVPAAISAWRSGRLGPRSLVLLAVLGIPAVLLTAVGVRSVRSILLPLTAMVALGAWWPLALVAAFVERRRPGLGSRAAGAVAVVVCIALAGSAAVVGSGGGVRDGEAVLDWSDPAVVDAARWIGGAIEPGTPVVVSWLFGWELYAQDRATHPMSISPTVLYRTGSGGSALEARSTLYRFQPLTDADREPGIKDLAWLRYVHPFRGYVGLSLQRLLDELVAHRAGALIVSGDSYQSTLDLVPVLDGLPGLSGKTVFGPPGSQLVAYRVDPGLLAMPDSVDLAMNGPTLRQLVDERRASGASDAAIAADIGAGRIRLVMPHEPDDDALLASLQATVP